MEKSEITQPVNNEPVGDPVPGQSGITAIRLQPAGKPYHFLDTASIHPETGDWVVVETVYGPQVGQVVKVNIPLPEDASEKELKPVLRRASGLDMAQHQALQKQARHMVAIAREELQSLNVKDSKAVSAEFTLDGKKAILFFTGNLSNKDRNALQRHLGAAMNCHIELRPIGPRDQAKCLGGYGVCGEPLCCARFLTDFQVVSIRMAKDQAISMAPSDITGMCGRLRCCLAYEHQVYKEESKGLPKRKARVRTENGIGRVVDWDVLKSEVIVEIPPDGPRVSRERFRFSVDEIEVLPPDEES